MKIYIHIGVHKTGSSAIQNMLYQNRDSLLKNGILYPKSGMRKNHEGHHDLAWSLTKDSKLMHWWSELSDEIKEKSPKKVIISSEEFEFFNRENWKKLKDLLDGDVRIVSYLRRQDKVLESAYKQHLKQGSTLGFDQLKPKIVERLHYASRLRDIESAFGKSALIVKVYERSQMPKGLYVDFLETVGIDPAICYQPEKLINPSLHKYSLNSALHINRKIKHKRIRNVLINYLLNHPPKRAPRGFRPLFSPKEREAIHDRYEADNREVAKRYLNRKNMKLFNDDV